MNESCVFPHHRIDMAGDHLVDDPGVERLPANWCIENDRFEDMEVEAAATPVLPMQDWIDSLDRGLRSSVLECESALVKSAAASAAFNAFTQIISITSDIFQVHPTVEVTCDPEYPADRYIVFTVEAFGSISEIVSLESKWASRIAQVTPRWDAFRLSIKRKK